MKSEKIGSIIAHARMILLQTIIKYFLAYFFKWEKHFSAQTICRTKLSFGNIFLLFQKIYIFFFLLNTCCRFLFQIINIVVARNNYLSRYLLGEILVKQNLYCVICFHFSSRNKITDMQEISELICPHQRKRI